MDLAQVLRELWRRRGWLALGALLALYLALTTAYRVGLFPPSLERKTLAVGVADTQLLVDTPRSALTDVGRDLEPLAARATVFTHFMTSLPVREAVARRVGLPASAIQADAPPSPNQPRAATEPTAAQRGSAVVGERRGYRLFFSNDPTSPTVNIRAQAPTARDAIRLANAGAAGFRAYVQRIQVQQGDPPARRVQLRQLGSAQGGIVGGEINERLAALAFAGAFVGWCLLVLLVVNVARSWRELEAEEGLEGRTDGAPS